MDLTPKKEDRVAIFLQTGLLQTNTRKLSGGMSPSSNRRLPNCIPVVRGWGRKPGTAVFGRYVFHLCDFDLTELPVSPKSNLNTK